MLITASAEVTRPGFYRMPAEAYHADPVQGFSLSSSLAKCLIERTPAHAMAMHPRLNPDPEGEEKRSGKMDLGSVAHKLLTGHGSDVVVVSADSWRTKAAKEQRDAAYALGQLPVLEEQFDTANRMALAARTYLEQAMGDHAPFLPGTGEGELVGVWQDVLGPHCRVMFDWLHTPDTDPQPWDYKTTSVPLSGDRAGRLIADMGYDVQAAFYLRGLSHLLPDTDGRASFSWLFQEAEPPYACAMKVLDRAELYVAHRKVHYAMAVWNRCMTEGRFPGYSLEREVVTLPPWHAEKWIRREQEEQALRDLGRDPFAMTASYALPVFLPRETVEGV